MGGASFGTRIYRWVRERAVTIVGVGFLALAAAYAGTYGSVSEGTFAQVALEAVLPVLVGASLIAYGRVVCRGETGVERGAIVAVCSVANSAVIATLSFWIVYLHVLRTGSPTGITLAVLNAMSVGGIFGAGVGHIYVDLTRHHRENERLSYAVDASMDGIAIIDAEDGPIPADGGVGAAAEGERADDAEIDTRHAYVNDAYASLYGAPERSTLEGYDWKRLYTNAARSRIEREVIPALEESNYWRGTLTGKRLDGTTFPQDVTVTGLEDGYVVVVRDVSRQRDREQQIQVLNRVLRHNLRNTFTVISGHANLIGDRDEELREAHVDPILEEIDDLLATADKARGVERTLERRETAETLEASEVIRTVVDRAKAAYPDVQINTWVEESDALIVDGSVVDALNELVDNAVEHGGADRNPDGGEPTPDHGIDPETGLDADFGNAPYTDGSGTGLTVDLTARTVAYDGGRRLEFSVADDGRGIPEAERRAVLEGEETPLDHGSGLGLWLVNWIVQNADGDLRFADRPGGGTIVTLSFPCDRERRADRRDSIVT
ncbi:ATP-binding protein [Natrialbaceae archaeon GCM10025810]|uniref:sensor histidine kinase n=1 Tax=Halovalidus salilacus TaxID=3075124 RepID=UPI00360C7DE2